MTDEPDPLAYYLPEPEARRIFNEEIRTSRRLGGADPRPDPVIVFMLGQPGAGKSATMGSLHAQLAGRGRAIELSGDPFKPHHPKHAELTAQDDTLAGFYTAADGRRWRTMAQDELMGRRVNLLVESAGRNPSEFDSLAAAAKAAGYRVEVVVIAAPEPLSRLGILQRYDKQRDKIGRGRMVTPPMHDSSYTGIQDAVARIDSGQAPVDALHILRRGNITAYSNTRDGDGRWTAPPRGARVLQTERGQWTKGEARWFATTLAQLREVTPQLPWRADWTGQLDTIEAMTSPLATRGEPAIDPDAAAAAQTAAFLLAGAPSERSTHTPGNTPTPGGSPGTGPRQPPRTTDLGPDMSTPGRDSGSTRRRH